MTGTSVPTSVDGLATGIDYLPSTPVTVTFTAAGVRLFVVEFVSFQTGGNLCPATLDDVVVQIYEADGSTAVESGIQVDLEAFNNNATPAEIVGTTTASTDADGIATFSGLCITKTGAYRWRATASAPDALDSRGESAKFNIRP